MYEEIRQPDRKERNLARVKIEGDVITIAEGQSFFDGGQNVFLIGPMDNGIDVFEELENDMGYEAQSGGYLSCIEVKGEFVDGRKFLIHALDGRNMKAHLDKILVLSGNETPLKVTLEYDKTRALPENYTKIVKNIMEDIDVEDISQ